MRFKLLAVSIILILVLSLVPSDQQASAASFEVNYTLTLEQEDRPVVTIQVQGYPDQNAIFLFLGQAVTNISSVRNIFQEMEVKDPAGDDLPWQWVGKGISVTNGSVRDFTIRYAIDAINYQPSQNNHASEQKSVLFRFRRIFFIAGDVFLTPMMEPENMTVKYALPEGTTLYASLPSSDGTFHAVRDLWGSLQDNFAMVYFAGGHAFFDLTHLTDWGDEYKYIWFDRDPLLAAWTPMYGNTPWEQAELYMESAETCARYFRDAIGPLPKHRVLFTNITHESDNFPTAGTNQDWYHYMQIWPRYSEPEICHHIFHQYSFWPEVSKMAFSFGGDPIGEMLSEGLPTYYEQLLPSLFFEDPRYSGKFFEFYVIDTRGNPFGIRSNINYHVKYNISALKVYLLDQYIRSVTDGTDSLDDFVKAMWEMVKDNHAPHTMSQADIRSAFSSVVGSENAGFLNQLTNSTNFDLQALSELRSPFSDYADWMIHEYFWDKPILFYMYLDISAAKGNNWPHFATYPHNVIAFRNEALPPVWDFLLSANRKNPINKNDILDAMQAATGQDHAGFFEFWESLGVTLDPQEIKDLNSWDPGRRRLEDSVPVDHLIVGNLRTEHFLEGVPQHAMIHLDTSAPTKQIYIEYQYTQEGGYLDSDEVVKVIQGENVSVKTPLTFQFGNLYETNVLFKITTDDPAAQDFPIVLTYPGGEGISRFAVDLAPYENQIGELYYLGPIKPIDFDLVINDNVIILPDTPLEAETYITSSGGETRVYKPGDKISLSLTSGPVEVQLMDQYGFLRGLSSAIPTNQAPTASFGFNFSDTDTPMTVKFSDTSKDPDGQLKSWYWDFGDGQRSIEKYPQHTYAQAGSYSVSLTVTDEAFGTDTHVKQILVGGELQNANQEKGTVPKLLLIGGGILLGCGLVLGLLHSQKKRPEAKKR
jgi:hypothetical protein